MHRPSRVEQSAAVPDGFVPHAVRRRFRIAAARDDVWAWLCDPATFTEGQPWPYRVEFVGGGFEDGVVCNHHGPFLSLPGEIRDVRAPAYRDLRYLYGAYAVTARWIRPARLQFWLHEAPPADAAGPATDLEFELSSFVRPWIASTWTRLQSVFWWGFRTTAPQMVRRHRGRAVSD